MKCHNCDKQAMFAVTQAQVPLCLDCYVKFDEANQRHIDNLERAHNQIADQAEMIMGIPGVIARYPPRALRTVLQGGMTLNHISISNSQIGVLNTGSIGLIDNAIGVMQRDGIVNAAAALKALTEAVAAAPDLPATEKNKVLEMVSLVATEAAAPPDKRRKEAMRSILRDVGTTLSASAALVKIWEFARPLLEQLF